MLSPLVISSLPRVPQHRQPKHILQLVSCLSIGDDVIHETDVLSAALYPKVFNDYVIHKNEYGPVEGLPTRLFFTGPEIGEEFHVEIEVGQLVLGFSSSPIFPPLHKY